MGNVFSGSEIVEIGIQIEKNGRDFYREVSNCSQSENSKKVFNYLMDAEEEHIETFSRLLSSVKSYEPPEAYPGEYFSYMKALADDHIFTKPGAGCDIGKKVSSDMDAINMGIGFEKDSIKFYEGMKKVVPEKDHGMLDSLIKEEQKHLKELGELKQILNRGE
jgi:rubrerythrin